MRKQLKIHSIEVSSFDSWFQLFYSSCHLNSCKNSIPTMAIGSNIRINSCYQIAIYGVSWKKKKIQKTVNIILYLFLYTLYHCSPSHYREIFMEKKFNQLKIWVLCHLSDWIIRVTSFFSFSFFFLMYCRNFSIIQTEITHSMSVEMH